eukprot:c15001_g1_i1 orf=716-1120(+)
MVGRRECLNHPHCFLLLPLLPRFKDERIPCQKSGSASISGIRAGYNMPSHIGQPVRMAGAKEVHTWMAIAAKGSPQAHQRRTTRVQNGEASPLAARWQASTAAEDHRQQPHAQEELHLTLSLVVVKDIGVPHPK